MFYSLIHRVQRLATSRRSIALLAFIGFASPAFAFNVYKVGGDAACGYTNIQDAIDAAKANPGQDDIFVAQNFTYSNQHLVIDNDDVIIEGGFPNCSTFDNGANMTILTGTSGHSIFEIEGNSHVGIWNFDMSGASLRADQKGGAIYFGGHGNFSITNDSIHNNTAGYGGAFAVNPDGPTDVFMEQNLLIGSNTALVQGGAIRIEGQTIVTSGWLAGQSPIYIGDNKALGQGDTASGGGIEVVGPASFNGSARIHHNTADYGAGIIVYAHNDDAATVNLYTTDAGNAVQVADNHAAQSGGGIFLKSADSGAAAILCMRDFSLVENTAQNGAAVYADQNSGIGSVVELNGTSRCLPPSGAVVCSAAIACNDISGNISQTTTGATTSGATISIQPGGEFSGDRFAARRNHGGTLVQFVATVGITQFAQDYIDLHDCVLADNVETGSPGNLVEATGRHSGSQLEIRNCTIANKSLSSNTVVDAAVDHATIDDSIFAQPGKPTLTGSPNTLANAYVLSNDTTTFGAGSGIEQGSPAFVDAGNQDYHLLRTSSGVDYAPSQGGVDLDGLPRTLDLIDVGDNFGPMDIGAYEIQVQGQPSSCTVQDTIFCNGFELTN